MPGSEHALSHVARRARYVVKRLVQAVPIILAIVVLNFCLLQLAEGDAVDVLAGEAGSATRALRNQRSRGMASSDTNAKTSFFTLPAAQSIPTSAPP